MAEDIFIDAEQGFSGQNKDTYEEIVLRLTQKCVDSLCKEVMGGRFKQTKQGEVYEEDVREVIINSVDTLEGLMAPFIKSPFKEDIEKKHQEIEEYYNKISEQKVRIKGRGEIKVKDLGVVSPGSLILLNFKDFKADKYREIFKILVKCYQKYKTDIASLSIE